MGWLVSWFKCWVENLNATSERGTAELLAHLDPECSCRR